MPTAMDLVHNTMAKKPGEFQTNFSELVTDRIRELIAAKRTEVAQNMFGTPPVAPEEPVEEPPTDEVEEPTDDEVEEAD